MSQPKYNYARECARRVRQAGFAHSLAQSRALDESQAIFRNAKAEREVARQAKVAADAATRAAVRASVTP